MNKLLIEMIIIYSSKRNYVRSMFESIEALQRSNKIDFSLSLTLNENDATFPQR